MPAILVIYAAVLAVAVWQDSHAQGLHVDC